MQVILRILWEGDVYRGGTLYLQVLLETLQM